MNSEKKVDSWLIDLDSVPTKNSSNSSTNESAPVSSVSSSISLFESGSMKPGISTSQNSFSFRMTVPKASSTKAPTVQTTNAFPLNRPDPINATDAGTTICSTIPTKQPRIGDGFGSFEPSNSLFSSSISSFGSTDAIPTHDPFSFTLFGSTGNPLGATSSEISTSSDNFNKNISKASKPTENGNIVDPGVGVIGMEMFSKNKTESRNPAFSFKTAENNNMALNSLLKKNNTIDAGEIPTSDFFLQMLNIFPHKCIFVCLITYHSI